MGAGERRVTTADTVRVEYRRGVCGAVQWEVLLDTGAPVIDLRADGERLSAKDLEDLAGALERIAARRRLSLLR